MAIGFSVCRTEHHGDQIGVAHEINQNEEARHDRDYPSRCSGPAIGGHRPKPHDQQSSGMA
jgi:hypothetical protein